MGKRGFRSEKGVPENRWGEPKSVNVNITMTPSGREAVKDRLKRTKISLSEVLELWGRGYRVDEESALALPASSERCDFESIVRVLPRLSRSQLGQLVKLIVEILVGKTPKRQNIAALVQENLQVCISILEDLIPEERLNAIAQGAKPTDDELTYLTSPLGLSFDELEQMRREEFGNGTTHSPASNGV